MAEIFNRLQAYGESDYYPYHMPGHKRRLYGELSPAYVQTDITEIDGFDNLHQPEGLIMEAQKRAAKLCKAEESFFLVNGSTSGVLSAVSAAVSAQGKLLMARNCHKSTYHAAYLRRLSISYLYPELNKEFDIYEPISPKQVEIALKEMPDVEAVLIVSPTYEGRIANVEEIAKVVHAYHKILIVDEAHGAHLGFLDGFSKNSNMAGADLVVQSVHKTLPGLTQSAILHVNGDRVDRDRLKRFLRIYQTSSPSYPLMASIENALEIVERDGKELFSCFLNNYNQMLEELSVCEKLRFLKKSDANAMQDVGKLLIDTSKTNISGPKLYDILLEQYHLQMEMAGRQYCLAMFTLADTKEGYDRLTRALLEIDQNLSMAGATDDNENIEPNSIIPNPELRREETVDMATIPLHEAWDSRSEEVLLDDSVGKRTVEFINLFPPGFPILVPGEYIHKSTVEDVKKCLSQKMNVQGVFERDGLYFVKCMV